MGFHIVGTQEGLISHSGLVLASALLQAKQLKRRPDGEAYDNRGVPDG